MGVSGSGSPRADKKIGECIVKAERHPDKYNLLSVLYNVLESDRKLKIIATQFGMTEYALLSAVNRIKRNEPQPSSTSSSVSQQASGGKTTKKDTLDSFCIDLTEQARRGDLPPVFCRDKEIDQLILALMKKTKANPLLIGDAGVGKTAIVEGLAQRISSGCVPERLINHRIFSLSLSSALSGTKLRGQFEERMQAIMEEAANDRSLLLFIDEVHMLVGSGGGGDGSSLDAGNIMKPYLARGSIRCIGATTVEDYNRYLRRDKALNRRFQQINIVEPSVEQTIEILRGTSPVLEAHHHCSVSAGVCEHIVNLCANFINDRNFPDKALDCLDYACARASFSDSCVTLDGVEEVVSEMAKIPVELVRQGVNERLSGMSETLSSEILGNLAALQTFCNKIRFSFATARKNVPLCVMTMYGQKGVGKKTAISLLAKNLYGDGALVVVNGHEFAAPHSIERILGSPPGYVGHREETYICKTIRKKPHSVILIKNPEAIHPSSAEQFENMISNGSITNAQGTEISFRNTIIVLVVDISLAKAFRGFGGLNHSEQDYQVEYEKVKQGSRLLQTVNNEVCFQPVSSDFNEQIIMLEMEKFQHELGQGHIELVYNDSCLEHFLTTVEGTPKEIREAVRHKLETALVEGLISDASSYTLTLINDELFCTTLEDEVDASI